MLPSTGYFKALNCPFYENGYCERPYCHFKHARRDVTATTETVTSESGGTVSKPQNASSSTVTISDNVDMGEVIREALKQALADESVINIIKSKDTDQSKIVEKVVKDIIPKLDFANLPSTSKQDQSASQCVYNPTPIAELKKRHISIASYVPTRESKAVRRKSPEVEKPWMDIIRNIGTDKESKPKKMKYTPTAISQIEADKSSYTYVPTAKESTSTYIPTAKESTSTYIPTAKESTSTYIPTAKTESTSNLYSTADDEYIPEKKKNYALKSKKRREEYVPRKPKISLKDDRLEDDSFDVLHDLLGDSISDPMTLDDEKCQDYLPSKIHSNNDNDLDIMNIDFTKEIELKNSVNKISKDENNKKLDSPNDKNSDSDSKLTEKEKVASKTSSQETSQNKGKEKSEKKNSEVECVKVDSKHSKSKDNSKSSKNKEEDNKSKNSKSKDKDKDRDRERDRSRGKETDKHKHSSKTNSKEHISSSKSTKSKEEDKDKKSSSHKSRDSKDEKKESRDQSRHKSYKKDKRKRRSVSSERKSKSNKSSHKHRDVHSSHRSGKTSDKPVDSEEEGTQNKSHKQEKADRSSPEYEEFSPMFDEQILEASDSEHDVEEECLKIFQEYKVPEHPKEITTKAPPKPEVLEQENVGGKKRVAHPGASSIVTKSVGPSQPPKRLQGPHEKMVERWKLTRELSQGNKAPPKDSLHNGNGRIRIAGVPYAGKLAREKEKLLEKVSKPGTTRTVAQTSKGGARVAHVPPEQPPGLIRPPPLNIGGTQKFPLNTRQFYVDAMMDICVVIYPDSEIAAQRAVREEHTCYEKCKALNVYKNSCMLTVHKLRKEITQKESQPTTSFRAISHEAVLTGKVKGTWSVIKPKKVDVNIKGKDFYDMLSKWIMTEQQLRDNGFPRAHPEGPKGRAKLYTFNKRGQSTASKVPNERYCCRCNKPYMVDDDGFPVKNEGCIYHFARKYTYRGKTTYHCCQQDGTSEGCCDATNHVWDLIDIENLKGYVSTFDKDESNIQNHSVFSLDCEMCYTTQGLELTRVTVINEDCKVVYETLVKPTHPILDYNTRFSGITENDLKNVKTSLLEVQATLLSMFSSKTILIGHSLESDFKALKLLHDTVVDTSVMFPHKNGPPFKRALKNLCSEILRKIIQNDESGHDSKEDASACMELALWKVKEEAKLL